jgi:MFS family permease
MPQVLGLIQTLFTGRERGRAFGLFGAIIGLSTAFGPTLGGLLIAVGGNDLGWRLGFWFNVPVALVLVFFAWRLLPSFARREGKAHLDLVGILLIGIAVLTLMLPFSLTGTGTGGSDDPLRWLWLAAFAAAIVAFVFWERRYAAQGKSPVINLKLLRLKSYRYGLLVATAYFTALPSVFLLNTLYLQQGLGIAPVFAGMVSIPFALASATTAWIGGRLVFRFGRRLVIAGLITALIGFILMLCAGIFLPPELTPWFIAASMLVAGAGGGFVISPNQTLTLSEIPASEGGVAGSVGQVGQRVGTAIGVAVSTSLFYAALRSAGDAPDITAYHEAFRNGFLVAIGFIVLTLVFALLDRGTMPPKTATIPIQVPSPAPAEG